MKKLAILSPLVLLATTALAQDSTCILQPSCSQLGYTSAEADCGNQKVLRCPFDVSQVACVGVSGGTDGAGGGDDTSSPTCNIGDIYYDDDTCSSTFDVQKNAIGIVFDTNRRYIIGLTESSTVIQWATTNPGTTPPIPPTPDELSLVRDFNGKEYTATLVSKGGYPAAEYCAGLTYGNKLWFLPSGGQWYLIHNALQTINDALAKIQYQDATTLIGYKISDSYTYFYYGWTSNITLYNSTSTEYDYAFVSSLTAFTKQSVTSSSMVSSMDKTRKYYKARCVAEY